jgi:fatty acid desaturase
MPKPDKQINAKYLFKRRDAVSLLQVVTHVAAAWAPLVLVLVLPLGIYDIALVAVFGVMMNGPLNLMHAAAHYHVFSHRAANMWLGRSVLGPMFFADFDSYQQRHWDHHRFLGSDLDTKDTYLVSIRGPRLLGYLAACLLGVEALKKFLHQIKRRPQADPGPTRGSGWLVRLVAFHALLASALFLGSYGVHRNVAQALELAAGVYVVGYLYAVMSITIFVAALRAIAEHQRTSFDIVEEGRASLRNFNCSTISRLVFGSYGFGEHLTHHDYPAIPFYHLRAATTELSEGNAVYRPADDYPRVLFRIVTER